MKKMNLLKMVGVFSVVFVLMTAPAMANTGTVKLTIGNDIMIVDGKSIQMDAAPYIQVSSGTTLVPLRFVVQALMGSPSNVDLDEHFLWDANNKVATVVYGSGLGSLNQKVIQFTVGLNKVVVNGYAKDIPNGATPEIIDGRCYIPIKAVSDAIGCTALWDANTKTITFKQG